MTSLLGVSRHGDASTHAQTFVNSRSADPRSSVKQRIKSEHPYSLHLDEENSSGSVDLENGELIESARRILCERSFPATRYACEADTLEETPPVEFFLDIVLHIDSGQCVLHPRQRSDVHDVVYTSSSVLPDPGSLNSKILFPDSPKHLEDTVFLVPAVDVKCHYMSHPKSVRSEAIGVEGSKVEKHASTDDSRSEGDSKRQKRAQLYAAVKIQSLSEEMLISSSLMDFLEQALEPLPLPDHDDNVSDSVPIVSSSSAMYTSFSVDVIVHVVVKPSLVRFSCQPMSRMECVVKCPQLQLSFTSQATDNWITHESDFFDTSGSNLPFSQQGSNSFTSPDGINFCASLSNLSLFIFHPFGTTYDALGAMMNNDGGLRQGIDDKSWVGGGKQFFALNIEKVIVNISRGSRFSQIPALTSSSIDSAESASAIKGPTKPLCTVRLSGLCHVGAASLWFDMRRLSEILVFPSAWHRRTLARRLFLGADGRAEGTVRPQRNGSIISAALPYSKVNRVSTANNAPLSAVGDSDIPFASLNRTSNDENQLGVAWETFMVFGLFFERVNLNVNTSNLMGNVSWTGENLQVHGSLFFDCLGTGIVNSNAWLSQSKIRARGGVIGGHIGIEGLQASGRMYHKKFDSPLNVLKFKTAIFETQITYMMSPELIARISNLTMHFGDEWKVSKPDDVSENLSGEMSSSFIPTSRPTQLYVHAGMEWDQLHILISRGTTPAFLQMKVKFSEWWEKQVENSKRALSTWHSNAAINTLFAGKTDMKKEEQDSSSGFVKNHYRHWQEVIWHLCNWRPFAYDDSDVFIPFCMSDLTGAIIGGNFTMHGAEVALACFHGINFRSRTWALFAMNDIRIDCSSEVQQIFHNDLDQPEHILADDSIPWSTHVIQNIVFTLGFTDNISRQTEHGGTFPLISGAQQITGGPAATISQLSRDSNTVHDWFTVRDFCEYAFSSKDPAVSVNCKKFPSLSFTFESVSSSLSDDGETMEDARSSRSSGSIKHETVMIFLLPRLDISMNSSQMQNPTCPSYSDAESPIVECIFVTEFQDHIYVAVDLEMLLFLNDLVTHYIKEKDKTLIHLAHKTGGSRRNRPHHCFNDAFFVDSEGPVPFRRSPKKSHPSSEVDQNPTKDVGDTEGSEKEKKILEQKDVREFVCKTWQLEPKVRAMYKSRKLESVSADTLLRKLGFDHARVTIPKWLQRGVMDPMDYVLSLFAGKLLEFVHSRNGTS